jgi:hypothetical protein
MLVSAKLKSAHAAEEMAKMGKFSFVQSAKGMTFDKASNKLTLAGVTR